MTAIRNVISGAALAAGLALLAVQPASAFEGLTPYQPGVSTGAPAGALPPPGVYGTIDNVFVVGGARNSNGNAVAGNVWLDTFIPSVLWVPNFKVLGATYGAAFVLPYIFKGIDFTDAGGRANISNGLFNPIISPLNLSWELPNHLFGKVGLAIYLPLGYTSSQLNSATGVRSVAPGNIANNFTTFEPDAAISYLNAGWNLTAHAVFDINTKNDDTNYQSGSIFYLDLTAARTFGKWTFGAVGNFTQQFSDDVQNGVVVNGGNRLQHILLGPLASYDFGPASIKFSALFGLHAENDANVSFYHVAISAPF